MKIINTFRIVKRYRSGKATVFDTNKSFDQARCISREWNEKRTPSQRRKGVVMELQEEKL